MNAPTVYLERDPTGQALLGLRLIGDSDSERWTPDEGADPAAVPALAAAWLRTQVSGRIGLLCIDPAGAVCAWLDTPSGDSGVVRAAARQAPPGMWGDWPSMGDTTGGFDWRAASVQTVTPVASPGRTGLQLRRSAEAEPPRTRSAVLALSDLPVRLLLDELDRAGVTVERVAALWHAMAAAWDPASDSNSDDDPLTARDTSDTAVVLIGDDGRMAWSWSAEGRLLAGGRSRLDAGALRGEPDAASNAAGRLSADWLAWTTQLGRAPSRIVCLVDDGLDDGTGGGIARLGRSFGAAWPGAGIDLFRVPDPIGSTLHRLRETTAGGKPTRPLDAQAAVGDLAARPGRAHKAMYRWTAFGLLAASALCITLGIQQRRSAGEAATEAAALTGAQRDRVAEVLPEGVDLTYPVLAAQAERDRLRIERGATSGIQPPPPILAGVEQIGFVVSSTDVRLEKLTLTTSLASVVVSGPTTESVELLPGTLRGGTDLFAWQTSVRINQQGGRYRTSISGNWANDPDVPEPSS